MNINFKYYRAGILIIVIIILFILLNYLVGMLNIFISSFFSNLNLEIETYIQNIFRILGEPLSVLGLISLFFFIYNKYLWKYPVFKLIVDIPNLNGRYSGKIFSDFGEKIKKDCILEIKQTASKIKIFLYIESDDPLKMTSSASILENIIKGEDGFYTICFTYFNTGDKVLKNLSAHYGYNELKYIPSEKKLKGPYYTHPERGRQGVVEVEFESKRIKGGY